MIPDRDLIKQYLAGDEVAFESLYSRHKQSLYLYLIKLCTGKNWLADDIFQKCWIKIINNLPKFNESGSFPAWSRRIAHNLFIDQYRYDKRMVYPEDMPDQPERMTPARRMENAEIKVQILQALEEINPLQREVFLLRQDKLSFKEIAEIQDCSLNTVLARMRYANINLKNILADYL